MYFCCMENEVNESFEILLAACRTADSNLAVAYGISVSGTMLIDTMLLALVARVLWPRARHAIVAHHALAWPDAITTAEKLTAIAQLKALGVLVRQGA